jgi:hypothetical protein
MFDFWGRIRVEEIGVIVHRHREGEREREREREREKWVPD